MQHKLFNSLAAGFKHCLFSDGLIPSSQFIIPGFLCFKKIKILLILTTTKYHNLFLELKKQDTEKGQQDFITFGQCIC